MDLCRVISTMIHRGGNSSPFSGHRLNVITIAGGGQSCRDSRRRDGGKYAGVFRVDRSSAACAQRRLRSFTEDSLQSLTYLAPGPRWAPPLYTTLRRPFDSVCTVGGVRRYSGGSGGGGEQAEEEGCRSELERTKRSFVGALYTAELY